MVKYKVIVACRPEGIKKTAYPDDVIELSGDVAKAALRDGWVCDVDAKPDAETLAKNKIG